METDLEHNIRDRLIAEFHMKPSRDGKWLNSGVCPHCGKKTLFAANNQPWLVKCNRLNNCGYETTTRDLYSDLFESWSDRFPVQRQQSATGTSAPVNPNATADAYMSKGRGFDLQHVAGCYSQESFYKQDVGGSATVRFQIDPVNIPGVFWERIIDRPHRFGKQKANFRGSHSGWWWRHPQMRRRCCACRVPAMPRQWRSTFAIRASMCCCLWIR